MRNSALNRDILSVIIKHICDSWGLITATRSWKKTRTEKNMKKKYKRIRQVSCVVFFINIFPPLTIYHSAFLSEIRAEKSYFSFSLCTWFTLRKSFFMPHSIQDVPKEPSHRDSFPSYFAQMIVAMQNHWFCGRSLHNARVEKTSV